MRTKAENFRNAHKPNFDLYVISFICINFEAFTTFSAIFTRICCNTKRDERTGMQRATLDKSGSKTASQLQDRTERAFPSNSLVKTMEMTVVIEYILTATQYFGSQDYCKKSRMTILGLAGVLFYENEEA